MITALERRRERARLADMSNSNVKYLAVEPDHDKQLITGILHKIQKANEHGNYCPNVSASILEIAQEHDIEFIEIIENKTA